MSDVEELTARLATAGFIAAREEARELLESARGDDAVLEALVERRLRGEPFAWITGVTVFCDQEIRIDHGVYVPRWQSEPLARRAVARLRPDGVAIDLCTGSGAIAMTLLRDHPNARVVATDIDERAVACAVKNGVDAYRGDLFAPLPEDLKRSVDVIVSVVPYVPTNAMDFLPRDTLQFESSVSYDGGDEGLDLLRRVIRESPMFLRPEGALLLELGANQAELLEDELASHGFADVAVLVDGDGDVRGIEATLKE